MPLRDALYKRNQTIVSILGCGNDKRIRIVTLATLRTAGVEDEREKNYIPRGFANEHKLEENLSRTKRSIYELAFCNPWEWFFTGTLNPQKYDRTDLEKYHRDFAQFLQNEKKRLGVNIKFLLIPEKHEDGKSWHMHGFFMGIPKAELQQFGLGDKMGKALRQKVENGEEVYNWQAYQNKFGFCDLEPIKSREAASLYVTKYITKSLAKSVTDLNAHQYYCSRGLSRAEVVKRGYMTFDVKPHYQDDRCAITTLPYNEHLLERILECMED